MCTINWNVKINEPVRLKLKSVALAILPFMQGILSNMLKLIYARDLLPYVLNM